MILGMALDAKLCWKTHPKQEGIYTNRFPMSYVFQIENELFYFIKTSFFTKEKSLYVLHNYYWILRKSSQLSTKIIFDQITSSTMTINPVFNIELLWRKQVTTRVQLGPFERLCFWTLRLPDYLSSISERQTLLNWRCGHCLGKTSFALKTRNADCWANGKAFSGQEGRSIREQVN